MGMKVLFVFNHPAPYKVKYFNELAKLVNLTVIFERRGAKDRNKNFYSQNEYNFNHIFLTKKGFGKENHNSNEIIKHLENNRYDFVIMNGYSTITEMRTIAYMNKKRIKYVLFINGGIAKEKESKLRRWLKTTFISGAEYYFSPNEKSNEYLTFYGADPKRIFNYPYSSINQSDLALEPYNKEDLRIELGLPADKRIVVSCGQFIKRKNYMTLLNAWKQMDNEYVLLLIGGGKLENKYRRFIRKNKMKNVIILNFQKQDKLFQYFKASDVFIFPSSEDINGHVINEAMSQGLPVISNSNVTSSLNLIQNAVNGYIYDPNNYQMMKDYIYNIFDKYDYFKTNAINTSKYQTIEQMAKKTYEDLLSIEKKPKIIYLTSSTSDVDYARLLRSSKNPPNPSNQNFHNRYLSLLSKYYNDITAISLRPFNSSIYEGVTKLNKEIKNVGGIEYYYLEQNSKKISKLEKIKQIYNVLDDRFTDSRTIILVDPLNLYLAKAALNLKRKYNAIVVAFLTDNPKNITKASRLYVSLHKRYVKQFSAYITLTKRLNDLFNIRNMPNILIEGVSENFKQKQSPQKSDYFFFGGALYERYGVLDVINVFNSIENKDYVDLVIAGHGPLAKDVERIAAKNRHIKFLGTISKDNMAQYEQHAIACINPRKKDAKLDLESIPSKVIEYASNKTLIISTYNEKLYEIFSDNILYYRDKEELKNLIIEVENNKEDDKKYKKLIDNTYKIVKQRYSEDVLADKLSTFFKSLLRINKKI